MAFYVLKLLTQSFRCLSDTTYLCRRRPGSASSMLSDQFLYTTTVNQSINQSINQRCLYSKATLAH